jgi:hypothetical protein
MRVRGAMSVIEALGGLTSLADCEVAKKFLEERAAELAKSASRRILGAVNPGKPGSRVEVKGKIVPVQTPFGMVGYVHAPANDESFSATVYYVGTETVGVSNLRGHAVKVPAVFVMTIDGTAVS